MARANPACQHGKLGWVGGTVFFAAGNAEQSGRSLLLGRASWNQSGRPVLDCPATIDQL